MTPVSPLRQGRRAVLLALGASMLVLAGCETAPRRPPPVAPPPAPPPPRPVEQRNKVAVLVPLTGEDGPVGQSIANAANLALLDSGNTAIRLTIYNTAEGGAAAVAAKAVGDGNRLILGPLLAQDVRAVAPVARRASVPVLAFSNDAQVAGDGIFILGTVPSQSIDRVVGYARGKGAERFAGLIPTGLYGQRAAQALLTAVEKSGGRVTTMSTYNRTPAAVRTAVGAMQAKGAYDAVLIADGGRIAAFAAPLAKRGASSGARILGTELWGNERTIGATAPALRGAWYAAVPNAAFDQLVTRYRARYGKVPYRLASLGYDSVLLTIRASRNWEIGDPFPTRLLADRDGFAGVDGIFRFGRDGVAQRALEVRQVSAGGSVLLSPAVKSFGD